MKLKNSLFIVGLLFGATGVGYGASADDSDPDFLDIGGAEAPVEQAIVATELAQAAAVITHEEQNNLMGNFVELFRVGMVLML